MKKFSLLIVIAAMTVIANAQVKKPTPPQSKIDTSKHIPFYQNEIMAFDSNIERILVIIHDPKLDIRAGKRDTLDNYLVGIRLRIRRRFETTLDSAKTIK